MLGALAGTDLVVVVVVIAAVLFGGAAIPKLARNLGSARSEFRKGLGHDKPEAKGTSDDRG